MTDYTFLGRSGGNKFCIEGIDVFQHKWQTLGEFDIVLDPTDKKPYSFSFYKVKTKEREIVFLAGKFQDDNWGFYQQKKDSEELFF